MLTSSKMRNSQAGFTLVEVAIVMVIIGLLIGGILKGQEMIKNARVRNVTKQADGLRAAIITYQDRYRVFPGDDPNPVANTGVAGLTSGNGNGQIAAAEDEDVFMHLQAAGLISGTYSGNFPTHAFGDTVAVIFQTVQGRQTHWINYQVMPADVARMIDTSLDDGSQTTGSIRANAAYVNDTNVTLSIEL